MARGVWRQLLVKASLRITCQVLLTVGGGFRSQLASVFGTSDAGLPSVPRSEGAVDSSENGVDRPLIDGRHLGGVASAQGYLKSLEKRLLDFLERKRSRKELGEVPNIE